MKVYILAILALLFVSACQTGPNTAPNITLGGAIITSGNTTVNQTATVTNTSENVSMTITGTEGDLIRLSLKAVDPDGDKLTYVYSEPFNDNGLWQTKDGDAGRYLSTITVTDGK